MDRCKRRDLEGKGNRRDRPSTTPASDRRETKNRKKPSPVRSEYVFGYPFGTRSPDFSPGVARSAYERQRILSDPSVCRCSVPLGFSLEPLSLPVYPALYSPPENAGPESDAARRRSRRKWRRQNDAGSRNETFVPDETEKKIEQEFASLPPVDRDSRSRKTEDEEVSFKRRFSDPGLAQASSDESSTGRDDGESTEESPDSEDRFSDFFGLAKRITELGKRNGELTKQLLETRSEMESLKAACESRKSGSADFRPGKLTDAICEIRDAAKMREDALLAKINFMLEQNFAKCKEVHRNLLEKQSSDEFDERLKRLEEKLENLVSEKSIDKRVKEEKEAETEETFVRSRLVDLEREKLELRTELREAVEGRRKAEEDTRRLERLVGILRKKINGVSAESCAREEKPSVVRPVSSALERNPFILANRIQVDKRNFFSLFEDKKKSEGEAGRVGEAAEENGASESGSSCGSEDGNPSAASTSADRCSSLPAQVTITGPVTDL